MSWRESETFIFSLILNIIGNLNQEHQTALNHLPLVEVEAGHEGEELSEVTLFEAAVETSFDQGGHSLKGSCPEVMSLSEQAEIDLELLEQLHQVVEMSRKGKMKDFVFSTVDVHHWHISFNLLCNLRSNELVNSLRIA